MLSLLSSQDPSSRLSASLNSALLAVSPSILLTGDSALRDPLQQSSQMSRASAIARVTPDPGNTIATSYNVGVLNAPRTFSDTVSNSDRDDYYRFTLGTTSNLSIGLTATAAAQLRLIRDANGNGVVDSGDTILSFAPDPRRPAQFAGMGAGTYFVDVAAFGQSGYPTSNYTLTLAATPGAGVPTEPNNTLSTAYRFAGNLNGTREAGDTVGGSDPDDFYSFNLTSPSEFKLLISGLTGDSRVDLIKDTNGNRQIDAGEVIAQSIPSKGDTAQSINLDSLASGSYFIRVYSTGTSTAIGYNLRMTAGPDWYSQKMRDVGLSNLARQLASDGSLNRNDMIAVLRNAEDGNLIDATELIDLRTLVSGRRSMMPEYVYNLSNKIVNGDPANQWWTGGTTTHSALGNLAAGVDGTRMERLIGKWFLGQDHPTAVSADGSVTYTYRSASGSLFRTQSGTTTEISYRDINQGSLGDCYFLSALAGTAFRSPGWIQSMFIDNGDNTWTVRFVNPVTNANDYVTVDRYLPTTASGRFVFANRDFSTGYNDSNNELWVALAEKSYAQIIESGWVTRWNNDHTNSYQSIDPDYFVIVDPRTGQIHGNQTGMTGGWPDEALHDVTGQNTMRVIPQNWTLTDRDRANIIDQFNAGRTVFLNWASHALTMVGYNATSQLFTIYNPWGDQRDLTWQQILNGGNGWESFTDWSYSTS